ncbi:MAG: LuxR family transcriptional regulator [Alphaproteobacteria bacterium]|nr:MAG: LuxR family transcriptional regulator [Alphaproteobacteria bacterium]
MTLDDDRLAQLAALLRATDPVAAPPAGLSLGDQIIIAARVPARHRAQLQKLTPMELTCMKFLGWGRANADIATLLMIAENTVRVHFANVCRKLELDGMRELAALAGLLFYPSD